MAKKDQQRVVMPPFEPGRALAAFKRQQAALDALRGRGFREAAADEQAWQNLTQSLIERTFGNPSSNLSHFFSARSAGYYNLMGIDDHQRQQNFEERLSANESLFKSIIAELELELPEEGVKGAYAPGDEYAVYRDLSSIISPARSRVLIVDAYIDEDLFNLYVSKVQLARVDILTNRVGANVETVAAMYATSHAISLRKSNTFHDRLVFVDDRGWVIGQSVKDAAVKKPTYMIELDEPALTMLRDLHESIFQAATNIV